MLRRLVLFALFCIAACVSRTSVADPKSEKRAIELYQESETLYKEGEFAAAASRLREAYSFDPNPDLLYNLARALEGLGEFSEAADAYERYLASAKDVPDRKSIEARVRTLRKKAAPASPPRSATQPRQPPPPATSLPRPAERPATLGPLPYILGGAGLAALATGGVLRLVALSKHDAAEDAPSQVAADRDQKSAERLARISNLTLAAGGVLTAAGVTLGIVELSSGSSPKAQSTGVRPPLFVALSGRF